MTLRKVAILVSFIFFPFLIIGEESEAAGNMSLGLKKYQEGDYIGALFYFNSVDKESEEYYPESLYWLAKSHYNMGDYNDSRIVIEKFFRTGSLITYYEDATFLYCIIYFKLKRYEDSLHLFQQYIRSEDYIFYRDVAYFWLGECYLQLEDFEKAKESFNKYLEYDPNNLVVLKRIETIENAILLLSDSAGGQLTLLEKASWFKDYIIREKDLLGATGESDVLSEIALIETKEQFFNWLDKFLKTGNEIVNKGDLNIINNVEKKAIEKTVDYNDLENKILDELEKKLIKEIGE